MLQVEDLTSQAESRTPRGFVPTFALASFGVYVAVLAPVYGGLSVKIQDMAGLDSAPSLLGIVTGAGAVVASVVQPIAGRLSDRSTSRFGRRRPFIALGAVGMLLGLIAAGAAPSFPALLAAWCFVQFSVNFTMAAQHTTLADQVPESKRGGVSGIIGAATPAAILGGALFLTSLPNSFLRFAVPAVFGFVTLIIFALALNDEPRTTPPDAPLDLQHLLSSFALDPRKHPEFSIAWLSRAMVLLGFGGVSTYLTLYLAAEYGMGTAEQLHFNAIAQAIGIGALVVSSLMAGFLSDRVGRRKPFVFVSGLLVGIGVLLVASSPLFEPAGQTVLLAAQAVIGMGAGAFFAVDQVLCIALLPNPDEMAKDLGILNLAGSLPGAITPFLAGAALIPLGNALFGGGYTLWFVIAGATAIAGAALILRIKTIR